MTKTGILALSTVVVVIFIIGIVGFIFAKVKLNSAVTTSPKKTTVEVTPQPTVGENVASPAAVINPIPSGVLSGKEATPSAQRVEVIISNLSFQPASQTLGKGSTIVWRNQDTVSHTVTAKDGSFNSGTIVAGDTFEQKFEKSKTYTYSCSIHPEMKGTIIVK